MVTLAHVQTRNAHARPFVLQSLAAVALAVWFPCEFSVTLPKEGAANALYGAYHASMMWNACSATWFFCMALVRGLTPLAQRTWAWSHRTTTVACALLLAFLWPIYKTSTSTSMVCYAELMRVAHMTVVNLMMYACLPPPQRPLAAEDLEPKVDTVIMDQPAIASLLAPVPCVICYHLDHTVPVVSLPCDHVFHETCIVMWFKVDSRGYSCPMCRRTFK